MKISIAVMMHPSREKYKDYLKSKLGDVPFSIDEGIGLRANSKRTWLMYDKTADFHIVVQDDALVCGNFREKVIEIRIPLRRRPVSRRHPNLQRNCHSPYSPAQGDPEQGLPQPVHMVQEGGQHPLGARG